MASVPVYFEQRRVGTIEVDKAGPSFLYDTPWIALRGAPPPELVDVAFGEPEPAISAIALSTIASVNWLARKGA
jgi:hypothetical protein